MTTAWVVLIVLSAGYVALAVYGKYRKLKDDYHEAVEDEIPASRAGHTPRLTRGLTGTITNCYSLR